MEELAKLEAERGTPGYVLADGIVESGGAKAAGGHDRGIVADGLGATNGRK